MKYWLILSFVFIVSCSDIESIDSLLGKSKSLFSNTKMSQEDSLLKEALISEQYGDYKRSVDLYNKLITLYSSNNKYLLGKANNLRFDKRCKEALITYDIILAKIDNKNKDFLTVEEGKGLCYMQEGSFDLALDSFKRVISEDATRWRVINAIGVIFALTGHDNEAIEYYNLALSIEPNYIILNNLGLTHALNHQFSESINSFRKALEYSEHNNLVKKSITLNLALVYGLSGQISKAEEISRPFLSEEQLNNNVKIYERLAQDKKLTKSYIDKALKP
ncbi:Flp pilus assembly protein TadD, contains TPR repeat [Rickettsiales bacterium Ac37b]|nr:Flp pilus assembly protein TadD, contains TPR repeat [Rickettsiales bacterium Ac37b]